MSQQTLAIGDSIRIKPDTFWHAYQLNIGGWQGRVMAFNPKDGRLLHVRWDGLTLEAMPEWFIQWVLRKGKPVEGAVIPSELALPAAPRDASEAWLPIAAALYRAHDLPNPGLSAAARPFNTGAATGKGKPSFDLARFYKQNAVPPQEDPLIRDCLQAGLDRYLQEAADFWRPDYSATTMVRQMTNPAVLGYGVVEILNQSDISPATKAAFVSHTLHLAPPALQMKPPYGLMEMFGFLAQAQAMTLTQLQIAAGMLANGTLRVTGQVGWFEGASLPRLKALIDWIAAHDEVSQAEKLWWAWSMPLQIDNQATLGKALARHWLAQTGLEVKTRQALCRVWALPRPGQQAGKQPLGWQLAKMSQLGDKEGLQALLNNPPAEPEELVYTAENALNQALGDLTHPDVQRWLIMSRDSSEMRPPAYLARLAVLWSVRLGESLEFAADYYWERDTPILAHQDALHAGLADALLEFRDQVTEAQARAWVERGIQHRRGQTRRPWYEAAAELFGPVYVQRALQDSAETIRTWAAKRLKTMS